MRQFPSLQPLISHSAANIIINNTQATMEQNPTITLSRSEWKQTLEQLNKLKQQNQMLRNQLADMPVHAQGSRGRHSLTQCSAHIIEQERPTDSKTLFKQQMNDWAARINSRFISKFGKVDELRVSANGAIALKKSNSRALNASRAFEKLDKKENNQEQAAERNQDTTPKKKIMEPRKDFHIIQSICLFGPDENSIVEQITNRKMFVKNNIAYCSNKDQQQKFKIYGEYFYPEGLVTARNVQEQEAPAHMNQFIFRKNAKKQDCSLLLFRGEDILDETKIENPVLSKINPAKWLSAFYVQFQDFVVMDVEETAQILQDKLNKSAHAIQGEKEQQNETNAQDSDRMHRKIAKNRTHYIKSKYTLCIFTYFPLINVMQQLISGILDEVKLQRVVKTVEAPSLRQLSIKFVLDKIQNIGTQLQEQYLKKTVGFDQTFEFKFGSFTTDFQLAESKIEELMFCGWVHDIVKIFEKDTIYDIFTNMMTEESICFVSENMHLLSYVIFFFVSVLPYPFTYPHPCISQVFNYELLESPFVVVAGINQSTKWLEQCVNNFPKKIFIDLNDEAKVKGKKKLKSVKSEKLKRIFNHLYKKLENSNSPMPQIFRKKSTIIRPASKEENESSILFLRSLQAYYNEQIFSHLPNPAIITFIKDKTEEKNETSKIFNLLKEIEKYLKQSRKQKERDQFIDMLIQQQIFYVHMGQRYGLN